MPQTWPYIDTTKLRKDYFDYGKFVEAKLRRALPSPTYWTQVDRKILWNIHLVRDYLLHGDGPEHQRLVQQYRDSLPGSHNRTA